jgi:hypothetical protein
MCGATVSNGVKSDVVEVFFILSEVEKNEFPL